MSLDRSLKSSGSMAQHRNVLTRAERITKMKDLGTFSPDKTRALGLPKVVNRKLSTGKKVKKAAAGDAAAPAAAAATPAKKPAGGAKK